MTPIDVTTLQHKWRADVIDDDVGLWCIVADVRESLGGTASENEIRTATLLILRPLLESGDLNAMSDSAPWSGTVDEQLARIEAEWNSLGEVRMGDIVTFVARGFVPLRPVPIRDR